MTQDKIARVRSALEFYSDPWKEEDACVPDFYNEMSFGDKAEEALPLLSEIEAELRAQQPTEITFEEAIIGAAATMLVSNPMTPSEQKLYDAYMKLYNEIKAQKEPAHE